MEKKTKHLSLSIKAVGEDGTIEGYGSVFGNVDSYGDIVERGAFTKTLGERGNKVKLLWQHDPRQPIGVWTNLSEDNIGLKVTGRLLINSNVPKADEAYSLLKAGALDGLSIGYSPVQQNYDAKTGINTVKEVKLYETSLVTFPANESASVTSVRSAFEELDEEQRVKTLTFINSLRNTSLDDSTQPPTSEASEGNTERKQQAEEKDDEPLLHSLEKLMKAMKA
jgi:uncharacterized protein